MGRVRVLIATDKFKGCLSAREVAAALAAGMEGRPGVEIERCPVADGGEGFAEAVAARMEEVGGIRDALGRPVTARLGWKDDTTAIFEMSEAAGHWRLAPGERNPWQASTRGVGQLICHAASRGARRVVVGLGGSATNDAGAGAAAAAGWQFLTSDGEPVDPRPSNFLAIERIEAPEEESLPEIVAACDVTNPLLGPEGATRVYSRQKGADDRMMEHLEMALEHLADLVAEQVGIDLRGLPGAGAAGGLGYGLATFFQGRIERGFELVAAETRLEERIAASDLVITGEGRFDFQSQYGKAPVEVARIARRHGKRVAMVCGQCEPGVLAGPVGELFGRVIALETLEPAPEICLRNAAALLARAGGLIIDWA